MIMMSLMRYPGKSHQLNFSSGGQGNANSDTSFGRAKAFWLRNVGHRSRNKVHPRGAGPTLNYPDCEIRRA